MEWSLAAGDAEAARAIRHLIADCLRGAAAADADLDSAELVVAELLSNVVTHTSSPARISLSWEGWNPELRVTDDGPGSTGPRPPADDGDARRLPTDPLATNGRGLYLVSRLAKTMTVTDNEAGGTTITVVLDVGRAR